MPELIAEHKQGLSWFDVMKRDYPDRVVFRFTDEVRTQRARPHSVPPTPMRPLGPYDVIDRLGRPESIQIAHPPAAETEASADVAGSKRGATDAANGQGSGNPVPRKNRRDAHCAQARAERAENQPAVAKAKGAAGRKRGQPQTLFN
jgi:hypothetical protein